LAQWEPRIVVDRVEVREVPEYPTHIRVELSYRVKRTGQMQQMGITLELEA
jgi:phage baseplate assembly protein W